MEGGGLLTYIKKSLIFEKVKKQTKDATATQTFVVKMSRNIWIEITNLYCPPATSQAHESIRLATETIPVGARSLIAGDFNAHSILWDEIQPQDARGTLIEDWVIDNDLTILNDCSATRASKAVNVNDATKGLSSPDVTLCGKSWRDKTTWTVDDPIGGSDHDPILIEVHSKIKHVKAFDKSACWKSRGVDWEAFKSAVEEKIADMDET